MIKLKTLFLFISFISLFIFRYYSTRPIYHNGDTVRITTTIFSDPIDYSTNQYIKIAGLKTYLRKYPKISYGDKVVIEGVVDNGKLQKSKLIKQENSVSLMSSVRNKIISFFGEVLPEPMGGLLAGVVLGAKGSLSKDFYDQTKSAGVAHVVVASGTNITFVVSFLMGVVTMFLPRRKAIPFVMLGIILYLFLSGFDAPLIRAAIMSSFIFLGQESGRMANTWRIFFLTALLMLIYNPDWLIDIGFILSFVSTGSLMLFERRINSKLLKLPSIIREGLSTSLAAQIGVAPILFITFGQFNIISPLINMLVLPVVAPIMILGALGGVIGLVFPFLGKLILILSYPLLLWFVKVVEFFNF